jgi:hypothetical protein
MSFYIIKASGDKELFDIRKFRSSLLKAGATEDIVTTLVHEIKEKPNLRSTKDIYEFALNRLDQLSPPIAARYNLKRALMDMGPAGYPFEHFVAELFRAQGYVATNESILAGACIDHEIDVLIEKADKQYIVECKFHNRRGLKSDVKVALYSKARFDDIKKGLDKGSGGASRVNGAWVVTNTTFTAPARVYGGCTGLLMLDWKNPEGKNLPDLIHAFGLHPITALTSLTNREKRECIKAGFVLCQQAQDFKHVLHDLHLPAHQITRIIQECKIVCSLTKHHDSQGTSKIR